MATASKADRELIKTAVERFAECEEASNEIYRMAVDDLKFAAGDQWPEPLLKARQQPGKERPCITENRLAATIHQICNDQRQNRTQLRTKPAGGGARPQISDVYTGMLRHIQYNSDSETAFDTAFESAVRCGLGELRVVSEYKDDSSFDQVIKIKRIDNALSVMWPLHLCHEIDFSDAPYCFIFVDIEKKAFEAQYPNVSIKKWNAEYPGSGKWFTEKQVRVAEYFYVEETTKTLYKVSDVEGNEFIVEEVAEGFTQIESREVVERQIKWCKLCAGEVLDRKDIPGKWIPVVPIIGEEINIEGKKQYVSAIRWAKDPQRMLNYTKSCQVESVSLAPKAPWVAAFGQLEGFEKDWQESNNSNVPVLQYKAIDKAGQILPAPQRSQPLQLSTALETLHMQQIDAIKATTGVFDASLGNRSNENSGVAIKVRNMESDTSNFHFFDNKDKSARHLARIIVGWIPHYYDTEREVEILGYDMKESVVVVNAQQEGMDADGKKRVGSLDVGEYDVVVDVGSTYMSKRQENADILIKMCQQDPTLSPAVGDLIAKNIDASTEVIERLQKRVPPGMLDDKNGQNPQVLQQQNAQLTQTVQQLDQVIQQMQADLEKAEKTAADKSFSEQVKLQIAELNAQVKLLTTKMTVTHDINKTAIEHAHDDHMAEIAADNPPPGENPETSSTE
jgi:hypothetical protein